MSSSQSAGARTSPLVGHTDELARLSTLADGVREAGAQLVLLSGEAGIGKSRLVAEFVALWGSETLSSLVRRPVRIR